MMTVSVGSVGISGQLCCDVEGGGEVGLVEVYDGEVGSLARLYGSRLILDVEGFYSVRARAVAGPGARVITSREQDSPGARAHHK